MMFVNEFKEVFEKYKTRPILVYGDPDVDGLFAMFLVSQFLDAQGLKYQQYVNDNRYHGFTLDSKFVQGYLIIAVDFDLTKKIHELVQNDVVVLSIDHHDIQDIPVKEYLDGELRGLVLNNQYAFEPEDERYNSGTGVVYEVLSEIEPSFKSKEREAMVGITLLSDIRPIENPEARAYLKTAYTIDTSQGYFQYLIQSTLTSDFGFGVPKMDRNYIDFTFSPTVNSLLRFGYVYEAVAFICGRGLSVTWTREKQQSLVQDMKGCAAYMEMDNFIAVCVDKKHFADKPDIELDNFIGLVASDIKSSGKSTIAFTVANGFVSRASFRGRFDDVKYKDAFCELGLNAQGHQVAFGIRQFGFSEDLWKRLDIAIGRVEAVRTYEPNILAVNNLSMYLLQKGYQVATENCYVRDMYRTYLKYTGTGARVVKTTFKTVPLTYEDIKNNVKPDKVIEGKKLKYVRDSESNPIPKYIEYIVDGKTVKSFGVPIESGYILPILDRGTVYLYVRDKIL